MTVTAKPWLGLYGGLPATTEPAAPNALQMFTNTLHRAPQAPLIHYFDTHITADGDRSGVIGAGRRADRRRSRTR